MLIIHEHPLTGGSFCLLYRLVGVCDALYTHAIGDAPCSLLMLLIAASWGERRGVPRPTGPTPILPALFSVLWHVGRSLDQSSYASTATQGRRRCQRSLGVQHESERGGGLLLV